jgi:DNA-binding CsgD family transcriptional regulator
LRETAVTSLARAGCTMLEIAQITGHSLQSIQQTLRNYLSIHPELAGHATA